MRWAIGIGLGTVCLATAAAEPLSAYPTTWTVVTPQPAEGPNLLDKFRNRIRTVAAETVVESTPEPIATSSSPVAVSGCSTCTTPAAAKSKPAHILPGHAHHCAVRVWECLTWCPGPAVIPKCVPTPYPGNFLTSFPCEKRIGFTPSAPGCKNGNPAALADPAAAYRALPGGPVLMPGHPVTPSMSVPSTSPQPKAIPPVKEPPAPTPEKKPVPTPMPTARSSGKAPSPVSTAVPAESSSHRMYEVALPPEKRTTMIGLVREWLGTDSDEIRLVEERIVNEPAANPIRPGTLPALRYSNDRSGSVPYLYPNVPFTNP